MIIQIDTEVSADNLNFYIVHYERLLMLANRRLNRLTEDQVEARVRITFEKEVCTRVLQALKAQDSTASI